MQWWQWREVYTNDDETRKDAEKQEWRIQRMIHLLWAGTSSVCGVTKSPCPPLVQQMVTLGYLPTTFGRVKLRKRGRRGAGRAEGPWVAF